MSAVVALQILGASLSSSIKVFRHGPKAVSNSSCMKEIFIRVGVLKKTKMDVHGRFRKLAPAFFKKIAIKEERG